jgi:hypothetical protein
VGAANVVQVFGSWPHLPDRAMRVLIRMAVTAMDDGMPPRYFGGWEVLAKSLGCVWTAPTANMTEQERREAERSTEAARRAVGRAVHALIEAGAVERLNTPQAGRRADYALML